MNYYYEDFTEDNYRRLLRIAKQNYSFINVKDYRLEDSEKVIINRHDIDASVHRAARLSVIEKEEGVESVYFVYLHSNFYNAFEKDIVDLLKSISGNGHEIGLHFEPWFYDIDKSKREEFEFYLEYEKSILETLIGVKISSFSFHNPDRGEWTTFDNETVCGLINMYSKYIKSNYSYCSDSDGYWRYRRLEDVLSTAEEQRLHILTHPIWWTSEVMKPRDRVEHAAKGRMKSSVRKYDDIMRVMGRVNEK